MQILKEIERIDKEIDSLLKRVAELEEEKQELIHKASVILPNFMAFFHRNVYLKIGDAEFYLEYDDIYHLKEKEKGYINNRKSTVKFIKKRDKVMFIIYRRKKKKIAVEKWKVDAFIKSAEEILRGNRNEKKS